MNFKFKSFGMVVLVACLLALAPAVVIFAQGGIAIDGSFADWAGMTGLVDPGGADDETTPVRADITEFRANADTAGLFLAKAWDNTQVQPSTGAGITVRGADGNYYRVYSEAAGNPASVALSELQVDRCTTATCASTTLVCEGAACTGAQVGSSTTWTDPFAGRASPACAGTDCGTLDTGAEFYIPWSLIGNAPTNGQTVFLQFLSYPTGPGAAPKDDTGSNGITCRNNNGVYTCYISDPTAVTLSSLEATSAATPATWIAGGLVLLVLLAAKLYEREFQYKLS